MQVSCCFMLMGCWITTGSLYWWLHGHLHELPILHWIPQLKPTETQKKQQGTYPPAESICCHQGKWVYCVSLTSVHLAPFYMHDGFTIDTLNKAMGKTQVTRVDIGWEVYYGYIWQIFVWAPSFSRILGGNIQVETDAGNSTGIQNKSCPLCTSIESALLT